MPRRRPARQELRDASHRPRLVMITGESGNGKEPSHSPFIAIAGASEPQDGSHQLRPFRNRCSNPKCLGTARGLSPAPIETSQVFSRPRTAARSSSTN